MQRKTSVMEQQAESKQPKIREFDDAFIDDCYRGIIGYQQFVDTVNNAKKNGVDTLGHAFNWIQLHTPTQLVSPFTKKQDIATIFLAWLISGCFKEKEHNKSKGYFINMWRGMDTSAADLIVRNPKAIPIYENVADYHGLKVFDEALSKIKGEWREVSEKAIVIGQGERTKTSSSFFAKLPGEINEKVVQQFSGCLDTSETTKIMDYARQLKR